MLRVQRTRHYLYFLVTSTLHSAVRIVVVATVLIAMYILQKLISELVQAFMTLMGNFFLMLRTPNWTASPLLSSCFVVAMLP